MTNVVQDTCRDDGSKLEGFRPYLRAMVRLHLGNQFQGKIDPSGVVQETLLDAHRAGESFPIDANGQLRWLRRALACNLKDALRKIGAAFRDVSRERSLEDVLEDSAARIESLVATDSSTPSDRVQLNEQLLALSDALEVLPDDQRTAIELRHLQGLSLDEIAVQMNRSYESVAGLLFRGLRQLRQRLDV